MYRCERERGRLRHKAVADERLSQGSPLRQNKSNNISLSVAPAALCCFSCCSSVYSTFCFCADAALRLLPALAAGRRHVADHDADGHVPLSAWGDGGKQLTTRGHK